jgi:hypothetical protein
VHGLLKASLRNPHLIPAHRQRDHQVSAPIVTSARPHRFSLEIFYFNRSLTDRRSRRIRNHAVDTRRNLRPRRRQIHAQRKNRQPKPSSNRCFPTGPGNTVNYKGTRRNSRQQVRKHFAIPRCR